MYSSASWFRFEDLRLQLGHGGVVAQHVVTHLHRGELHTHEQLLRYFSAKKLFLCVSAQLLSHRPCRDTRFENECFAEMWSGSEEGSYLRLIDFRITQL